MATKINSISANFQSCGTDDVNIAVDNNRMGKGAPEQLSIIDASVGRDPVERHNSKQEEISSSITIGDLRGNLHHAQMHTHGERGVISEVGPTVGASITFNQRVLAAASYDPKIDAREESTGVVSTDPSAQMRRDRTSTGYGCVQSSEQAGNSSNYETSTERKDATLFPRAVTCVDDSKISEAKMKVPTTQNIGRNRIKPPSGKRHIHQDKSKVLPVPRIISFVSFGNPALSNMNAQSNLKHLGPHCQKNQKCSDNTYNRTSSTDKYVRKSSTQVYDRLYNDSKEKQNEGRKRRMEIAQKMNSR